MEGIADGRACDDCFVCSLLLPDDDDCAYCHKRMRYLPAAMMDEPTLAAQAAAALARFDTRGDADSLEALLTLLHRFPAALESLPADLLPRLRRAWTALNRPDRG